MFALYELALNQDIQNRLRMEIQAVFERHSNKFSYEAINEMKYLDMVFKETLRKFPVADTQFRKCTRDFPIPNTNLTIPRDTFIMISSFAVHHDERFYDNPSKFDPDRFTEENSQKRHPFVYLPFGESFQSIISETLISLVAR